MSTSDHVWAEHQPRPSRRGRWVVVLILIAGFLALGAVVSCNARPDLEFAPANLPDARVGTAYDAVISVSQNATPVGGAGLVDGSLPAGLTLVKVQGSDTVRISGTPASPGTFKFTLSVWCLGTNTGGQTAERGYAIVVR